MPAQPSNLPIFQLCATVVLIVTLLSACGRPSFAGTVLDPPFTLANFSLTEQHGRLFRLGDQQGKMLVVHFSYAYCTTTGPETMAVWKRTQELLGEDADRVRFAIITVDPERDTPELMGKFVSGFSPDFFGLTGTAAQLEPVYKAFFVYHEKGPLIDGGTGYDVSHTVSMFVIDGRGRWRLLESYGTGAQDLASDIRALLKSKY